MEHIFQWLNCVSAIMYLIQAFSSIPSSSYAQTKIMFLALPCRLTPPSPHTPLSCFISVILTYLKEAQQEASNEQLHIIDLITCKGNDTY